MEYYSPLQQKEILAHATTWTNPEGIMQRKVKYTLITTQSSHLW